MDESSSLTEQTDPKSRAAVTIQRSFRRSLSQRATQDYWDPIIVAGAGEVEEEQDAAESPSSRRDSPVSASSPSSSDESPPGPFMSALSSPGEGDHEPVPPPTDDSTGRKARKSVAFAAGLGAAAAGGVAAAGTAWGEDSESTPDALDVTEYEDDTSENDDDMEEVDLDGDPSELPTKDGEDEKDKIAKRSFLWGVTATAGMFIGSNLVSAAMGGSPVDEDDIAGAAVAAKGAGASGSVTAGTTAASTSQ
jgi:hypothetical protein